LARTQLLNRRRLREQVAKDMIAVRIGPDILRTRTLSTNSDLQLSTKDSTPCGPSYPLITPAFRYSFDALVLGLQFFSRSEFLESFLHQVLCAHFFDGRDIVTEPANLLLIR
jgi:hypothetical protein